jgi:hypothetical protein
MQLTMNRGRSDSSSNIIESSVSYVQSAFCRSRACGFQRITGRNEARVRVGVQASYDLTTNKSKSNGVWLAIIDVVGGEGKEIVGLCTHLK